jgi:protein TonB
MNARWLFRGAIAFSVLAHAALLIARTADFTAAGERTIEIPVVLEAEVEPPSPPPPPEPPKRNPRPRELARHVEQVVESDGTRAGELVEAEVGDYWDIEEVAPELAPPEVKPPPEPLPKPSPKPEVDRVQVARTYLQQVRGAIAGAKQYPFRAQRMGIGGSVSISFVILASSQFGGVGVKRSSGYDVLDQAALRTVRSLSGQLPRPPDLGDTPLRASITLLYQLDGQHQSAAPCGHHERGRHSHGHAQHRRQRELR